jgi:hypothetical protein
MDCPCVRGVHRSLGADNEKAKEAGLGNHTPWSLRGIRHGQGNIMHHPKRAPETIRLDDIDEMRLVTTSDGPLLPDQWHIFTGNGQGCSVPSEAREFEQLWDIFKTRFPGFNYEAIIQGGTSNAQKVLWKKS